ncbi:MAG: M48 family metallopeptidase [Methanobacteriaceae archaeon]|nr:M48 family metallopeptidase [Methanobacteriaceae archaeon]
MKVKINDIEVKYHVFHRKVKYARLEIKNGELDLIMPHGVNDYQNFIKKHENWIYQKISRINRLKIESEDRKLDFSREENEFRELVKSLVNALSKEMDLKVNRVSFRKMKTRWGSCSNSGNININSRLKYLPESLIEYVVHHEICHLKIRKHNKDFWNLVALKYPDYKKNEEELSIYWLLVKNL